MRIAFMAGAEGLEPSARGVGAGVIISLFYVLPLFSGF